MLSPDEAQQRASDLVALARRVGADAADAAYIASSSQGVQVRLGKLEEVERSEDEQIALRVFCGRRTASIGSSDLGVAALTELAERAIAMARAVPEDSYAGLAPEAMLARAPFPDLDLHEADEPGPQALRDMALEAEDAARAIPGVTNSEGGSASSGESVVALVTSHGFAGGYASSSRSLSATVVSGEGSGMQRDYAWRQARHGEDLLAPAAIGRLAGERAVAKQNPGRLKSGPMPVILDPRMAGTLIGHLVSAMSGQAIARRASFLLDRLDEELFDPVVRIVDEPLRKRGLRSRPFDGEGLEVAARSLVEAGRVTGWLLDSASARQLGLAPTGHASRSGHGAPGISASNVHLAAGPLSPEELMADIEEGVYVTELFGHGINGVTGDYSRGAAGFRIVKGERAGPVAEFTIAGNLLSMFRRMTPASDLEWFRPINVPTVRIDGMTVAGD